MRNLESILNEVAKIVSLRHHLSSVFMEAQFFSAAFSNFLYGIGVKAVQELKKVFLNYRFTILWNVRWVASTQCILRNLCHL